MNTLAKLQKERARAFAESLGAQNVCVEIAEFSSDVRGDFWQISVDWPEFKCFQGNGTTPELAYQSLTQDYFHREQNEETI